MRYRPNRQEQTKAHQMELPFPGWGRRRADNDSDPFASGTNPTRSVFQSNNVRPKATKFSRGLTLADFAGRIGPGPERADCCGQ
ncbi:hypothetical protein J2X35_003974 [Mesorhizobium sp. BE184]|nr:hypothetical protein [Mesorhizobium sp. BE184]